MSIVADTVTAHRACGPTLSELKMGALISAAGGLAAVGVAALLRIGRFREIRP
jgi:hypothetical protein